MSITRVASIVLSLAASSLLVSTTRAQFSPQSLSSTPPTSATSPAVLNVGQNYQNALTFTITFGQLGVSITSIEIRGTIPPGLSTGGTQVGDANVVSARPSVTFFGTPTTPGDYRLSVNAITSTGLNSISQVSPWEVFFRVVASGTAPTITTQPSNQATTTGGSVTFTVAASGDPAPSFQWRKDGIALGGATGATLTLANVAANDAGNYTVVVTNAAGSVTSSAATLTIGTTASPAFVSQPISVNVVPGSTVALNALASGTPAPSYQWRKAGAAISGATNATLVLNNTTAADAASYTVVATNSAGSATSNAAVLAVAPDPNFGRLANLSILTGISAGDPQFTLGTVIGGAGTSGSKALLVRAVGPSLAPLGVTGALSDPKLDVLSGQTVVATNDNWNGDAALATAFAQLGAFAFLNTTSRDAATFNPTTAAGGYTIEVSGVGGATGQVIAEIYDATPAASFTTSTPRLVNVSVLKQISAGTILTAGFVVGGGTAKTVLIRAIGPALGAAPFNISGAMADPKLDLFSGQTVIASNDNWAGDAQLTAVGTGVGAFAVSNTGSRDAMLVVTLPPGSYTVQVSGAANSAGTAIVEVYEVP